MPEVAAALLSVMNFVTLLFSGLCVLLMMLVYKHWKYWKKVNQYTLFTMIGLFAFFVHEALDYFPSVGDQFSYLRFFQGIVKLMFIEFFLLGLFFAIKEISVDAAFKRGESSGTGQNQQQYADGLYK